MVRDRNKVREDLEAGRGVRPLDVAKDRNVSPSAIYGAIRRGDLEVDRLGRTITITNESGRRLYRMETSKAA